MKSPVIPYRHLAPSWIFSRVGVVGAGAICERLDRL